MALFDLPVARTAILQFEDQKVLAVERFDRKYSDDGTWIARLYDHLKELDKQVDELDAKIQQWHKASDASKKLAEIPGIGPITATALVASIGDAKNFENGVSANFTAHSTLA